MSTPEPFAILFFLEGFRMEGFCRSSFVMERMMARTRSIWDSSISGIPPFGAPMVGSMLMIPERPPSFFIWSIWSRKSLKSTSALRSFSVMAFAFSSSTSVWAFSIRERMSPMPRIREAIRSG